MAETREAREQDTTVARPVTQTPSRGFAPHQLSHSFAVSVRVESMRTNVESLKGMSSKVYGRRGGEKSTNGVELADDHA